jgi:hypothetical protein
MLGHDAITSVTNAIEYGGNRPPLSTAKVTYMLAKRSQTMA